MNEYIYLHLLLTCVGVIAIRSTFFYDNNILNEKIREQYHNIRKQDEYPGNRLKSL
jgi:hypothetical protein